MKKLFALLLSVVLALSACAFAEEAAPVTHSHRLSNFYLISGEEDIYSFDFALELDVSGVDKPDAARIHLDSADETVAEIGITLVDDVYAIHMESENLGHVDYAIDPVALLSRYMDKGVSGLVELLQSLNTTEIAQGLLGAVGLIKGDSEAVEEPEAAEEPLPVEGPENGQTVEISLSQLSLKGNPLEVLQGCVSGPETSEMGGVEYAPNGTEIVIADGTYNTYTFDIDTETLCTILNMVCIDGEPSGLGEAVRESGVNFEVHGTYQSGEEEGLNKIWSITASLDDGNSQQDMAMNINTFYGPEGSTSAVSYGLTTDEMSFGLGFTFATGQHEGETFTSGSIDMDSAIPLTDLEMDEILDTLGDAMSTVGDDAANAIVDSLMEALMAGIDLSELEAE